MKFAVTLILACNVAVRGVELAAKTDTAAKTESSYPKGGTDLASYLAAISNTKQTNSVVPAVNYYQPQAAVTSSIAPKFAKAPTAKPVVAAPKAKSKVFKMSAAAPAP